MKTILILTAILTNIYAMSANAEQFFTHNDDVVVDGIYACLNSSARIDLDSGTVEKGARCDTLIQNAIRSGVSRVVMDIIVTDILRAKALKNVKLCALDIEEIGDIITCDEEIEKARMLEISTQEIMDNLGYLSTFIQDSL